MADPAEESYREHVRRPRNVGEIEEPDGEAAVRDDTCGDLIRLTLRVREAHVEDARFRCFGCGATVASISALTDAIRGMHVNRVRRTDAGEIIRLLPGIPGSRLHAAELAGRAVREAVEDYDRRRGHPSGRSS